MRNNDNKVLVDSHLKTIVRLLEDIKYGSVTIIAQDGKVILIERNEKFRIKC